MTAETISRETQPHTRVRITFWRWFWRTTLVVSLAYAAYCFYVPGNNIAWADDFAAAQRQATEVDQPIILYFTGQWCVPCRIMKREVWAAEDVAATVNERFVPVLIDIGNPDHEAVAARYNVRGTPVTIITDPEGNALDWKVGRLGKTEFLTWIGTLSDVER